MPIKHSPTLEQPDAHLVIYRDHHDDRRRKTFGTKPLAEKHLIDHAGPASRDDLKDVSCASVLEWFVEEEAKRGCSAGYVEQTRQALERFLLQGKKTKPFGALEVDDYDQAYESMLAAGLAETTIYSRMGRLADFCNAAYQKGFSYANHCRITMRGVDVPRSMVAPVPVPEDDVIEDLLQDAPMDAALIVSLMADGGAAPSEIIDIRWQDHDPVAGTLLLRGTTSPFDPEGAILARKIVAPPRLAGWLLRWRAWYVATDDRLFPFTLATIGRRLHKLQVEKGLIRDEDDDFGAIRSVSKDSPKQGLYTSEGFRRAAGARYALTHNQKEVTIFMGLKIRTVLERFSEAADDEEAIRFLSGMGGGLGEDRE